MSDKFNAYDFLGILIPGTLFLGWVPVCFPGLSAWTPSVHFPDAFAVLVLTALAVFLGQLIQALASLLEPGLFWTWRGRPSDLALKEGLKDYLPLDTAKRINEKISSVLPSGSRPHSAFLYAMQQASSADNPRVDRFNTLYAYHRGLLVLVVLGDLTFAAAMFWGSFSGWTLLQKAIGICLGLLLILLVWYRAWQRACYYVREVLLTAERVLDGQKKAKE